ncbi:Armadillo-type fold [Pseudocohnilembus persalinus]|uniref:Armadillo-type fold n=1 Tax=Pseudocohnilembus persalinus TaxID=266149 RepID=A0A0V0QE92_PSEPJ|nr:Armadillo-type fold [Pseudocohnilembus persalinus]|eukprot:KRX00529.1 Armadillo-type fold [Pseudocohnilembus persalinus]
MYWNTPGFEETKKDFGENADGFLNKKNSPYYNEVQTIIYQNLKKILGHQLQIEAQAAIKEALESKYEVVENQNQYLQRLLVDPDKQVHLQRENKLIKLEGEKLQQNIQFQELLKKKDEEIKSIRDERNQLSTENYVLQRKIWSKIFEEEPPQMQEFYDCQTELRLALENKNLYVEKLNGKLEHFLLDPFWEKIQQQNDKISNQQSQQFTDRIKDIRELISTQRDYQNSIQKNLQTQTRQTDYQEIHSPLEQQSYSIQQNQKEEFAKDPTAYKDLLRKYKELEELLIRKNKEIQDLQQDKSHFQEVVSDVYSTLKVYYQQVIEDKDLQQQYIQKLDQCQIEEKNKNTQINTILEELLLNYRGIEVQVKEEIMQNQKKMQQLENELSKKDEMIKMDYDKAKEELLTSMGKLQEAQNIITQLQNQLQNEQQEKQEIMKEFELNKSQLLKKVAELNSEVAKVLSKSDQEVSKIKIENLKNKQQAMQLMTMLTERENEIATLRIKITQNDEELKRLRKKNISITGEITGPYKPHLCQQINQNRSDIKLASLITPAKSTLKAESFQNSKGFSLPNINFNNKRNRGRSLHTKVNNEMQLGDGDPFFKIRFIRTIKEWAVYWKYYNDNYQIKLQLLDKLLTTKKLREDFSISQDIKLQVLKEAINSSEEEMFETITHLLAELLDLNQLNKEELEDLDIGSRIVRSLRVPKDGEDEREFTNLQISGLKILSFMDMENMHWSQHMSEELMNVNGLKCLSESIKQTEKQWIRMLAFQTLHLMASQKALIPFMISYKINSELLLSIEEMSNEVIVASLGYFSALLKDEQFINSISDIKGLLKLNELLFHQDPGVVANTLLCINNVIPNFTYHKSLYKENVLQKIGDIAGHSIDIKTRLHALKLIRTLIDHGTEMEIDQINEIVLPQLLENILLPYNETLKEISPERDLILQTLKITSSIIEDFQHPDEEKLAEYILKLLCHSEIKNDPKIEKNTTEIVFKLWKTSEDIQKDKQMMILQHMDLCQTVQQKNRL